MPLRVFHRQVGRRQAELDEEVVPPLLLLVHELEGVEALHLAGDPARQRAGIEAGDGADAALAGDGRVPRQLRPDAERRHQADAGHHDATFDSLHLTSCVR